MKQSNNKRDDQRVPYWSYHILLIDLLGCGFQNHLNIAKNSYAKTCSCSSVSMPFLGRFLCFSFICFLEFIGVFFLFFWGVGVWGAAFREAVRGWICFGSLLVYIKMSSLLHIIFLQALGQNFDASGKNRVSFFI